MAEVQCGAEFAEFDEAASGRAERREAGAVRVLWGALTAQDVRVPVGRVLTALLRAR